MTPQNNGLILQCGNAAEAAVQRCSYEKVVLGKRHSENLQQICSMDVLLNLLHIFRTAFPKNTFGQMLLQAI